MPQWLSLGNLFHPPKPWPWAPKVRGYVQREKRPSVSARDQSAIGGIRDVIPYHHVWLAQKERMELRLVVVAMALLLGFHDWSVLPSFVFVNGQVKYVL